MAQSAEAKAQGTYQNQLVAANNATTGVQLSSLRIQQSENRESAARELDKAKRVNTRAKSSAVVAAGEAGITGNSVDALLNEYSAEFGRYSEATTRQTKMQDDSYADQATAMVTGAKQQNLSIQAPIAGPNYAASAVNVASSGLGAYASYNPSAFKRKV